MRGSLRAIADDRAGSSAGSTGVRAARRRYSGQPMSPTWIWMQIAIVVFIVIGMVIAITKLA
jgi:hypothetical protein